MRKRTRAREFALQILYQMDMTHENSEASLNNFWQAHNDYLEFLYNTGIVGLGLFLSALFVFLRKADIFRSKMSRHIFASLSCIGICAIGTFVFQLGVFIIYTLTLAGMLQKQEGEVNG